LEVTRIPFAGLLRTRSGGAVGGFYRKYQEGVCRIKKEVGRIEQRTLIISIYGVVLVAVGSITYGLFLESDVVILNGIFSLCRPSPNRIASGRGSRAPSAWARMRPGSPSA
jgi:hypothetical protein